MFQNHCLMSPFVEYDDWQDFERRLNDTYKLYVTAIAHAFENVPVEDTDIIWMHNMFYSKLIDLRNNKWNFLYVLTKKSGSWWCMQAHRHIMQQVELVLKTYTHTLMAHPDIRRPWRHTDQRLLQTLIDSEIWNALTRSDAVGHTFLRYPFSGEYDGIAGVFAESCFVKMRDVDGTVLAHIPQRTWHNMQALFILASQDERSGLLFLIDDHLIRTILNLVMFPHRNSASYVYAFAW